jgi:transcriptional regulator with XRE-family HTH domain
MSTSKPSNRKAKSLDEPEEVYKKIGKRLKELRLAAGFTNAEKFAFEHEITRSQYANYEKGMNMKIGTLLRILRAHNISLTDFFHGL